MSNSVSLKRRINSVRNTRQITKAMEMVAASKMHKSQELAKAGRAYQETAFSLLTRLNKVTIVKRHPLFTERQVKCRTYVVISSNRGLAGAYNANVLRELTARIKQDKSINIVSKVIAVGSRAARYVQRIKNVELMATYAAFDEAPTPNALRPILRNMVDMFTGGEADEIYVLYTKFINNVTQKITPLLVLPAKYETHELPEGAISLNSVTFEPSVEEVLENVTERLIEAQLWQAVLEGNASEQSMRMMAMKNATDNAADLIEDLNLTFNSIRQAGITQELADITGGSEAMREL